MGPQFLHVLPEMNNSGFRVLTNNEAISSETEFPGGVSCRRSVPGLSRKEACIALGRHFSCSLTPDEEPLNQRYTGKPREAWILWS